MSETIVTQPATLAIPTNPPAPLLVELYDVYSHRPGRHPLLVNRQPVTMRHARALIALLNSDPYSSHIEEFDIRHAGQRPANDAELLERLRELEALVADLQDQLQECVDGH